MASRTLYRAFRPTVFDDVSGQDHVTEILKRQIAAGEPAHAYLFCGTRGTGKTTTARILANAVNCENPQDGNPCGACEACRMFSEERFADVTEIDAASNSGVDNIRDIREKAALLPIQGRYKVYIIDEAHMLSAGAFNALLKTLEEPPAHTIFILATTELRKIPKTILSRCQHFDFHRITNRDIVERLRYVAGETGVEADDDALMLIAEQAEGALRDALSLFEQCSAGATRLEAADVLKTLGLADTAKLSRLGDSILQGDAAAAVAALNDILSGSTAPASVLQDLVIYLSDELARTAEDGGSTHIVLRAVDVFIEAQNTLRFSPVPQAVLLAAVIRAANTTTDVDLTNLEARLQRLEAQMERLSSAQAPARQAAAPPAAKAAAPSGQIKTAPAPEQTAPAPQQTDPPGEKAEAAAEPVSAADPPDVLRRFRSRITEMNGAARPAADAVTGIARRGGTATLYADREDETAVRLLVTEPDRAGTLQVLEEIYGVPLTQLRLELEQTDDEQSIEQVMSALSSAFSQDRVTMKDD